MSTFLKYVLSTLFSTFIFSFLFSFIIMALILKNEEATKFSFSRFFKTVLKNKDNLIIFLFIFFTFAIFFTIVIQRECIYAPLSNVLGGWSFFNSKSHKLDYLTVGNILIFIPSSVLFCIRFLRKETVIKTVYKAGLFSFLFSLFIELNQLIFSKGTFQFSDIVYNTLGGLIGALIYLLIKLIKNRINKKGAE